MRDPQTGKQQRLTVIGVLSDTAPLEMAGIWTSQATLAAAFGDRVDPDGAPLRAARRASTPTETAKRARVGFLANGMQADSLEKLLDDAVAASLTFDRLIMGFMGLGLIVGVAALGVISARSVVERRQQIGVLRAIGFRRRMVQRSFLLESSFVALTAIVVGTALGLAVAYSVIDDRAPQPSWESMSFVVPWVTLALIFLASTRSRCYDARARPARLARLPGRALRYQ